MSNFGGASFLNPNKTDYTSLVAPGVTEYWRDLGADKLYGSMVDASRIKADAETDYYKKAMEAKGAADSAGDAPRFAGQLIGAGLTGLTTAADAGLFGGGGGGGGGFFGSQHGKDFGTERLFEDFTSGLPV